MQSSRRKFLKTSAATALPLVTTGIVAAQGRGGRAAGPGRNGQGGPGGPGIQGNPQGAGAGRGQGGLPPGRGGGQDAGMNADQQLIHTLLENRGAIRRQVNKLLNGVETLTETDNNALRPVLVRHVAAMQHRVEEGRPIHMRDPLFRELFRNADRIRMDVQATPKGVRVLETSDDPHVASLIQQHAEVVSLFIRNGYDEVRKNHAVQA